MRFLAAFLLAFLAFASLSAAVDISACTNLAASTSYRLTGSISNAAGTCMNVTGNSVTLDMNGFTIDGTNAGLKAAFNATASGVTGFILENGTVTEWDSAFREVGSPSGWTVRNVTFINITNSTAGSLFSALSTSLFTNLTIRNSTIWSFTSTSSNNNFTNSNFVNCAGTCLEAVGGSDSFRAVGISIINGSSIGLDFSDTATDAVLVNNANITNVSFPIRFNNLGSDGGNVTNVIIWNSSSGLRNDFASQMNTSNISMFNTTNYVNNGEMNFTNLTLGYNTTVKTNWPGVLAPKTDTAAMAEGTNIYAGKTNFISVNDTALPFLNTTANAQLMSDVACTSVTSFPLFKHTGLPSSKAAIMALGSNVSQINCSGGLVQFTIGNFTNASGYAPFILWLGRHNETPSSGSGNVSTWLYVTFYDESSGAALNIDSASLSFSITPNAQPGTGTFEISYSGTNTTGNATVRGYPDGLSANLTSIESYAKSGYTTRSRFMTYADTPLNVQQNVSIYLISDSLASYSIINVVNNGNPVAGAYVSVLKFFASSSAYTLIDQKITNSQGQSAGYFDPVAYYKFLVYDSQGNLVYTSSAAEQFICDTTCQITINIGGGINIQSQGPYPAGICYGNSTTNFINFIYSDATGLTQNITFLAWRAKNYTSTTPVCNNTVSASSGAYNCNLTAVAGENLSVYPYYCEVRIVASPERPIFGQIIDLVAQALNTDWLFPGLAVAILCGAAGLVSPVIGLAAVGVGVTGLYLIGILPLTYTFVVYILIGAGMLIFLKAD